MPSSYSSSRKMFLAVPFRVFLSFTCALSKSRFSRTFSGKKYSKESNENRNCMKETKFQSSSFTIIRARREKHTRTIIRSPPLFSAFLGEFPLRETHLRFLQRFMCAEVFREGREKKPLKRTPRVRARHRIARQNSTYRSFHSDISL